MSGLIKKIKQTLENKTTLQSRPKLANSDISLLNKIEEKLTQIWHEILEIKTISANDNFFDLGGHSILAMKCIVRIKEKFEIQISYKDFMNSPTISMQSELIRTHLRSPKGTILATKGMLKIKKKFEIEMSFNDFMNSPKTDAQVKSIKTRFNGGNDGRMINDIIHSENVTKFPLTETQKSLWYLCKLNNNSPAYNLPFTIKFTGELNREILHKTIEYIFKRHKIIFATFHSIEGEPFLLIKQNHSIKIQDYDLVKIPEEKLEKKYNEIISADSRMTFDIEFGPLFRLHLLKIRQSEWLFHMTIHHLVFDGTSYGIFLDEFNNIYNSLLNTEDIKLENIKYHQYDYAKWLEKNHTQANSHSVEFWKKYLDGIPAYINFPLDRSRKKPPSGIGAKTNIIIPSEIAKKIITFSKIENTTVFTTMLSAFSLLIKRFSGENDFCIGFPITNRPHQSLENIFGLFVDTFALRFNFDGITTFLDLLKYTKSTILNIFENRDIGYYKTVEIINPERNVLYNSLFQIAFVWPNDLSATIKLGKLEGKRFNIKDCVAPFDITFYMWEIEGEIEGEIDYNIDLFDEATIRSIRDSYLQLLASIVNDVKANINNLKIVSDNQLNILQDFNNTKAPYPQEDISSLLKQICDKLPKKIALSCNGQQVNYSELEIKSNQIALELIKCGVKKKEPVGIFMNKSNELILSMIAILKVNCYYLPLDPEYPIQRTIDTIQDAGCNYVITSEILKSTLTCSFKTITINDSIWQNKATSLSYFSDPEDFAYIMYTSGTTGKPKGSIIKQKSIVRLVRNSNYISLTENDSILLSGAIGFDATTFEIWGALLNGCTLFIVEKDILLDSQKLETEINKNDINVLWLTSSLFTQITELNPNVFASLRCLLIGGDVLSIEHVNKIRNLFPALAVINGYGPTENTTFSTCHLIQENYQDNIPIGKPISNSTAYIFNESMKLQPIGAFGELYVGGDGLSFGYLNRPELNAEKFVFNPLNPGEKLFKTGDKARWLPDGIIEFHGRIDDQLKIRGFRVEPLEIEVQINNIPEIIESVIKPIERQKNNIQLYAFVNKQKESNIQQEDIISYLKKTFPSYMIPSFYDFRNSFPKTVNGKIDRKALKFKSEIISSKSDIVQLDLNDIEKKVYNIFADTVKRKDFGSDNNFFNIGGNSLLSLKVISQIEKNFGITLKVRDFMADFNSVKRIAKLLSEKSDENKQGELKSQKLNQTFEHLYCIQSNGNDVPVFGIFCDQIFTEKDSLKTRSIYDFTWPGSDGRPFTMNSVEEIAQNYLNEMQRINPVGPYYLLGFSFGGLVAFDIALKLRRRGYQVPVLILIDSANPAIWESPNIGRLLKEKINKYGFAKALFVKLFNAAKHQAKVLLKKAEIYFFFKLNKKLSIRARQFMIYDEVAKLALKYYPEFYDGEIHIFKSNNNTIEDAFLGWKTLAAKIKTYELEGHHVEAIRLKNNKISIVKQLKRIIKEVERTP